jgi:threonylcarbamoyladenosine tRNA methylthiotransferase MtaB
MKFAVCTLGCKVNTYESEYVISKLKELNYEYVDFNEYADIYIINTCTVTNTSDGKSRKMIRQARKKNENAIVDELTKATLTKLSIH